MRKITNQTEEEFLGDKKLHKWWNQICQSEEFFQVIDAINRRSKHDLRLIEQYGIKGSFGYRKAEEDFLRRLETVCKDVGKKQENGVDLVMSDEPDFEESSNE